MKTASTPLQQTQAGPGPGLGRLMAVEEQREAPAPAETLSEGPLEATGRIPGPFHPPARPWQLARACALLAGGVALIPTPAPGILLILWGLKGLGRGFRWARRIEVPIRRRLRRTRVGRLATGIG